MLVGLACTASTEITQPVIYQIMWLRLTFFTNEDTFLEVVCEGRDLERVLATFSMLTAPLAG